MLSGAHLAVLEKYRHSQINHVVLALSVTCYEISIADIIQLSSHQKSHIKAICAEIENWDSQLWAPPPPTKAFDLSGLLFLYL